MGNFVSLAGSCPIATADPQDDTNSIIHELPTIRLNVRAQWRYPRKTLGLFYPFCLEFPDPLSRRCSTHANLELYWTSRIIIATP